LSSARATIAPRKLFTRTDSLPIMNRHNATPSPASTWRARFLEIARQVEGELARPAARPSGLRARSRMAGFATLRLAHRGTAGTRLA
jgi:hypothetical protein